ncbi:cytochrome c biogenesis protein CcdA [Methanolobus psychrotolerans]|uniref:cytochrome c biogenesis protein CcdA n=1 Tax=Methanolobus psychrotolerans TaxID=1874706 RepID=UPI000B919D7E|nr:cytochrome c biogenesis protein CcdA [Methanolobus psychrotolerans]
MTRKIFFLIILFVLSISVVDSAVNIEYFYQTGCHDCKITTPIIDLIESEYDNVNITRTDVIFADGLDRWKVYGFREVPAIVVNNETLIPKEEITEDNIRTVIVNYSEGQQVKSFVNDINLNIPIAYSLGLFAGMSPCLMAILGFILSLTAGTSNSVKNGMTRAGIFGLGLVSSYIAFGLMLFIFKTSVPDIKLFSVITGIVVLLIGFYLMGLYSLPVSLEGYFQNAARKHASTISGLFILGVLFSFVKVPCTLPMLLLLLERTITQGTLEAMSLLLVFSVGVLTPFIGVGLVGGYTLTKHIREYRKQVKIVSGAVLILLGIWMVL